MGALVFCLCAKEQQGPLAQLVEQWTFNPLVAGSRPARPTRDNQRYQSPTQRYKVLKNQSAQLWGTGSLIAWPSTGRDYNSITDHANETLSRLASVTASSVMAPLALPEYVMEGVP